MANDVDEAEEVDVALGTSAWCGRLSWIVVVVESSAKTVVVVIDGGGGGDDEEDSWASRM